MVKPHKPEELEMKVYPEGEPTPEGIKPVIVFSGLYVSAWLDDKNLDDNKVKKINKKLKEINYDKNNPYAYKNRKTRANFIEKYDKGSSNIHPDSDAPTYYIVLTRGSCIELNEIESMVDKILSDINSIISESEDNDLSSIELSLADYRKAIHVKYFYNVLTWKLIYNKISSDGYLDIQEKIIG